MGRLPTRGLDICRLATAFVPLGVYGLSLLLLTGPPVATMALQSLLSCVPGSRVSKGPNAQEVCAQANFEGRIHPKDKWQEVGWLGEA